MKLNEKDRMRRTHPVQWIPSLYFAEGVPYVIVMTIAVIMYKRMGMCNSDVTLYTSWLYLPWVIKPFWSPFVDIFRTKRWWILLMQVLIGAALAGVAFTLPASNYIQWTLAFFWLMAFSSATHDIAADGFYMLELNDHEQALYVGVRSTCYRVATIAGQGLLIILAGSLEVYYKNPQKAWTITFLVASVVFLLLFLYHYFYLPNPESRKEYVKENKKYDFAAFVGTFVSFFRKPGILAAIAFMLLYRFPEALLTKVCQLFLLDKAGTGGLALSTSEVGLVQGTMGVIGLLLGGILGGFVIARDGFQKWIWPMVLSISLPNVVYVLLAYYQPDNLFIINVCVFVEQMGYGFGFTAYMLFMIYFSQGPSKTAHYAFCTGFMALSMMLPGLFAGWIQEKLGYLNFFILVMGLVPLTFWVASLIKVEPMFGKETKRLREKS